MKLLRELNLVVPPFGPDNGRFLDDPMAQGSLQDYFAVYVDLYLYLIYAFRQVSPCTTVHIALVDGRAC